MVPVFDLACHAWQQLLLRAAKTLSAFPSSMGDCHDTPNRVSYSQLNMITERTTTFSGALDLHSSLPPIGRDASRPRFGTDPVQAQAHACCSSDCEGQACSSARILMRRLASELILLDTKVRSISEKDYHLSNDVSLSSLLLAATAAAAALSQYKCFTVCTMLTRTLSRLK